MTMPSLEASRAAATETFSRFKEWTSLLVTVAALAVILGGPVLMFARHEWMLQQRGEWMAKTDTTIAELKRSNDDRRAEIADLKVVIAQMDSKIDFLVEAAKGRPDP